MQQDSVMKTDTTWILQRLVDLWPQLLSEGLDQNSRTYDNHAK